jgi:hypothetical protein
MEVGQGEGEEVTNNNNNNPVTTTTSEETRSISTLTVSKRGNFGISSTFSTSTTNSTSSSSSMGGVLTALGLGRRPGRPRQFVRSAPQPRIILLPSSPPSTPPPVVIKREIVLVDVTQNSVMVNVNNNEHKSNNGIDLAALAMNSEALENFFDILVEPFDDPDMISILQEQGDAPPQIIGKFVTFLFALLFYFTGFCINHNHEIFRSFYSFFYC